MSGTPQASEIASPTLPHFAGLTWRLDVPRASRASASSPQPLPQSDQQPVYNLRLSLAHVNPTPFTPSPPLQQQQEETAAQQQAVTATIEDVAFACSPDTLLALADAVEAAVKQSEQAPYRRILRLIR